MDSKDLAIDIIEVFVPLVETLSGIVKDLTGEDLMEDDARYLEMAKELLKTEHSEKHKEIESAKEALWITKQMRARGEK